MANMRLEQYKAIIDYCIEKKYNSKEEFLQYLKKRKILEENEPLEKLANKVSDQSYKTMYRYLKEL